MKKVLFFLTSFFFICSSLYSQYQISAHHAGPAIGLTFLGSTISFGGNYEYGLSVDEIGLDAPGKLGLGGIIRYWSYDEGFWSYTDLVIAAQANYHFELKNNKIDPYLGLVLGYDVGSWDWTGPFANRYDTSYGGFIFGAAAGVRYWFSPTMAVNGRLGAGSNFGSTLDIGLDFKF